jgi:hypothetical protein
VVSFIPLLFNFYSLLHLEAWNSPSDERVRSPSYVGTRVLNVFGYNFPAALDYLDLHKGSGNYYDTGVTYGPIKEILIGQSMGEVLNRFEVLSFLLNGKPGTLAFQLKEPIPSSELPESIRYLIVSDRPYQPTEGWILDQKFISNTSGATLLIYRRIN